MLLIFVVSNIVNLNVQKDDINIFNLNVSNIIRSASNILSYIFLRVM